VQDSKAEGEGEPAAAGISTDGFYGRGRNRIIRKPTELLSTLITISELECKV